MYKVLIVDDEIYIRERLRDIIPWHEYGLEVIGMAEDGEDALSQIGAGKPDIVISDVRMPDMNGLDMIRLALDRYPDTKFVVLSAYGEFEFAKKAIRLGVTDYLLKPTQPAELLEVMMKLVDRINQKKSNHQTDSLADIYGQTISSQYIHELVLGQHPGYGWEEEYANVGLGWLLQGNIRLILVTMNRSDLQETLEAARMTQFAVQNVMYETISGLDSVCPVRIATGRWLIAAGSMTQDRGIRGLAERLYENILTYTKHRVNLLISEPANSVLDLSGLFWRMEKVADFSARSEEPIQDMKLFEEGQEWMEWSKPTHELIHWIVEGETDKINQWISQLSPSFLSWDLEAAQRWCFEWLTSLRDFMKNKAIGGNEAYDEDDMRMQIASQYKQRELLQFFSRDIHRMMKLCHFDGPHPLIKQAIEIIKRDYGHDIQLALIAEDLGLSPVYLSEFFKKETGVTFRHYLLQVRMNEAARLLKDPRLKVYEVADIIGYRKVEHFAKLFKKQFGLTPSEYRGALV